MVLSRFFCILPIALLLVCLPASAAVPSVQDVNQAFRQGNNAAALEKVNAYLTANPKDAQGRFLKGLILTELNRQNEAIKIFTDLTEDYPELPEPYNNLAVLYASQGQYDRARNSLEMAIRTHPSYATAHENLGDIYAKMASQSYDKALQLDKSNTSAQTKLAMISEIFTPMQVPPKGKAGTRKAGQLAKVTQPEPLRTPPAHTDAAAEPAAPVKAVGNVAPVEKVAAPTVAESSAAVLHSVHAWVDAWAKQDADAYLASYSANFKVPGGHDRAAWEAERKSHITRPKFIKIKTDAIKVELQGNTAIASFTQRYVSSNFREKSKKILVLEKQGDAWKIVEER